MVVDLSQNCDRMPWHYDAPSLHKASKLFWRGQVIEAKKHFALMGWPDIALPQGIHEREMRRLAGNMLALPVAGVVMAAALHYFATGQTGGQHA